MANGLPYSFYTKRQGIVIKKDTSVCCLKILYACTHRDIYVLTHSSMTCNQSRAGVLQFGYEVSPEKTHAWNTWSLDW